MWKCVGLTLVLGQFIAVSSQHGPGEDELQRHSRKAGECCPCPDNPGQGRDAMPSESDISHNIDCPCKSRGADLESASSILSPTLRAVKPFARQFEQKTDPKPLLEPEVGLASSVLETLREVTEEEYKDAVVRDAARSVIQSAYPEEASTNLVTVVVSPDARESIDDVLPEASNNQERRCILPAYENYAFDETSVNPLQHNGMLQRMHDMADAPSNHNSDFQVPMQLKTTTPSRSLFGNVPVSWARETPSLPHEKRVFYIPTNRGNNLFRKPLLPILDPRMLFSARKPLDIANLLNLRDVELVPAKKVTIARGHQTRPESIANEMLSPVNNLNSDFNNLQIMNSPVTNLDAGSDCNWDGTELNQNFEDGDKNIHTDILNAIPTASRPIYYNENNYEPQNNMHHGDNHENTHKNFDAQKENIDNNCINGRDYAQNNIFSRVKIESEKGAFNRDRNNVNQILTSEASNNLQVFQHSPDSPEVSNARSDTEGLHLNNLNIHDRLKSAAVDASHNTQGKSFSEACIIGNEMKPDNYLKQGRSNNAEPNKLSMQYLQKMSDSLLNGFNNVVDKVETPTKYTQNKDPLQAYRSTSDNIYNVNIPNKNLLNNYHDSASNQGVPANKDNFRNNNFPIDGVQTNIDHEKESTNTELCYENDKSARTANNEMKTAASAPFHTQYRTSQHQDNFLKNSLYETPLEDINLDIFQYQPALPSSNSLRNSESPLFNIKSYRTQLPVPRALDFQPVKLQKAIRRGSDILGATLTMKPHTRKNSLLKNRMRSSLSQASGIKIPDIDDIRAYIENNPLRLNELPFLSNLACNHLSPIAQQLGDSSNNINTYADNLPLREGESIDPNLMNDPLFNPSDVIETITEAREDIADKLNTLRLNLDDRIKQFHQSITDTWNTPTLRVPQQSRVTNAKYNPVFEGIQANRKNIFNNPPSPGSNLRESRLPASRPSFNRETLNRRPSFIEEYPAGLSSKGRLNRPTGGLTSKPVGNTGLRQADTKRTPTLIERLKLPQGSKGIISLTTTKRPPVAPTVTKSKPALSRPSTIQSRISQPKTGLPERIGTRGKETIKESKTLPSAVPHTKTPILSRTPSLSENIGRESTPSRPLQFPSLRNTSAKSNIGENAFLTKVKEAVLSKNSRTSGSDSDITPSASESVRHTESANGISFNCKMVCEKS